MRFTKADQDHGYKALAYRIGALTPIFYTEHFSRSRLTRTIRVYRLGTFENSGFGDLTEITKDIAKAARALYNPKTNRIVLRGTGSDLAQDMFEEVFDRLCGAYNVRHRRQRAQRIE